MSLINQYLVVKPDVTTQLIAFGNDMALTTGASFSLREGENGENCDDNRTTTSFPVRVENNSYITFNVNKLLSFQPGTRLYLCLREGSSVTNDRWVHLQMVHPKGIVISEGLPWTMPIYITIFLLLVSLFLSACFSGLHIGILKLDKVMLQVVKNAGSEKEKRYATAIIPIRENGNRLLCTLLLSNVAVNVIFSLLTDRIFVSGIIASVVATLALLLFGEILPQAICTNYGLVLGAKTVMMTRFLLFITAPVTYPMGLALDKIFGKEIGQVYDREELKALILAQKTYGCVEETEVNIITGALSMVSKTVKDVMTPINNVYMMPYHAILDFQTTNDIITHGYTRVPVYDGQRSNICTVLNVKDLAFIDPNDKIPVATVCKFYNRKLVKIDGSTPLYEILKVFKKGSSHMAVVTQKCSEVSNDEHTFTIVGVVTLEDVIEEILQEEIIDETDIIYNVNQQKRLQNTIHKDLCAVINSRNGNRITPPLKLAALRHISTNIKSFDQQFVNINILQSFLNGPVMLEYDYKRDSMEENVFYTSNESSSTAMFILQGNTVVEISKETLHFETGAFMFFGEAIFTSINNILEDEPDPWNYDEIVEKTRDHRSFVPDYTVTMTSNIQCVEITAEQYILLRYLSRTLGQDQKRTSWLSQSDYFQESWENLHLEDNTNDIRNRTTEMYAHNDDLRNTTARKSKTSYIG